MPRGQSIDELGQWSGYRAGLVQRFEPGPDRPRPEVLIELHPDPRAPLVCDGCGRRCRAVHDVREREIRDLDAWGASTVLIVWRQRVACPRCGPRLQRLDWLRPHARVTTRLAEAIAAMCRDTSIRRVAEHFGLGWDTVKAIDKAHLERTLGEPDLTGVTQLAIDEFAVRKGQKYATVVLDVERCAVVWVGPGRTRDCLSRFFEQIGPERCRQIEAVAIDRSTSYRQAIEEYCPQAKIVADLFHVIAWYGRTVIDRLRVDEANRLRSDPKARRVIKGSRWLLLRQRSSLKSRADRIRLDELLSANRRLMTAYVLRDELRHLWTYRTRWRAERLWKQWYGHAVRSRIDPLRRFAKNLKRWLPAILNHCDYPLHTSVLEGVNNRIKVIKRVAYGFRDEAYFFLKIRAAFPGRAPSNAG